MLDELRARAAEADEEHARRRSRTSSRTATRYVDTVDAVVRFLQGRDPGFALRIVGRDVAARGPAVRRDRCRARRRDDDPLAWAFGALGVADRAKHLASLYIDDLADVIRDGIDAATSSSSRYGERLAASAPTFDPLRDALEGEPTLDRRACSTSSPRELSRAAPARSSSA